VRHPQGPVGGLANAAAVLAVNARLVPTRKTLAALARVAGVGRRCRIDAGGTVAAALLTPAARDADAAAVRALLGPCGPDAAMLDALGLPASGEATGMLSGGPHDVVTAQESALEDALAARIDAGGLCETRRGLHVAADARVDDLVAVRGGARGGGGPVVVESGAEVGPFVCLDGPAWIGPGARLNPHTWIRPGTSVGRECRVGGEVEATVFEPFSNKPHEGFLGHSHVGSWVNLAAGTVAGNLKSTYGEVRLHDVAPDGTRATEHTGRQFLGTFVAELARSAVGTLLPCGGRVGVAATIGGAVPDRVPHFHNMLVGGSSGSLSTVDQAATILERMMRRRGVAPLAADRDLLAAVAAAAVSERG